MDDYALVLNAGSSSLKFCVYRNPEAQRLAPRSARPDRGHRHDAAVHREGRRGRAHRRRDARRVPCSDGRAGARRARGVAARDATAARACVGVGHRVVHGGAALRRPDGRHAARSSKDLRDADPAGAAAPAAQPRARSKRSRERLPGVPQVACFDTSFHRGQPAVAELVPLPREIRDGGVQRYGFHGLSYEYIASVLPRRRAGDRRRPRHRRAPGQRREPVRVEGPQERRQHARLHGARRALHGDAARRRSIPASILLPVPEPRPVARRTSRRSSTRSPGCSASRASATTCAICSASDEPGARLAVDYFVYRAAKEIGALAAVLGGLDALVFTAGIGENSPEIRRRICEASAWLGVDLDADANAANGPRISRPAAACRRGSFRPTRN